ncbi:hypothetical protein AM410_14695 [Enterobacter cloacae complex sp. FDA-CDC-AR_0164]|nr:hypothetical protein AM379_00400 [Enterobacter cloacae complex sp. FDA-CDC-AR_0132]AWC85608.1 hypothetical protein AM410_14695 [Enterobacter cloacae complex sp. FDA-CDC-AR_0164]RSW84514.1 hypothetical protein EGH62_09640 [Klebsiella aerogenes]
MGLPVVAGVFRKVCLQPYTFGISSGLNRLNHGDDLLFSKTDYTHGDLLCWLIDYARVSLNVNETIM